MGERGEELVGSGASGHMASGGGQAGTPSERGPGATVPVAPLETQYWAWTLSEAFG